MDFCRQTLLLTSVRNITISQNTRKGLVKRVVVYMMFDVKLLTLDNVTVKLYSTTVTFVRLEKRRISIHFLPH